jgi:predicted negative regulator of RcsB-dependent stress response
VRGDALHAKNDTAGAIKEYVAALSDPNPNGLERGLVELKVTDLGGKLPEPKIAVATKEKP